MEQPMQPRPEDRGDAVDVGLDHRDGVVERPRQRDVDVVHDEDQLPGLGRHSGPAQGGRGVGADTLPRAGLRHRAAVGECGAGDGDGFGHGKGAAGQWAAVLAGFK